MDPAPLFSGYEYSGNKYSCAENHMSHKQHMDLWDTDSFFSAEKFWRCGSIISCRGIPGMRIDHFLQRNSGDRNRSFSAGESRGCGSIIFCRETLEMRVDYFLQRNPGNAEQSYPVRR
jgi:hypothetical protein